jgi:ComF family protein
MAASFETPSDTQLRFFLSKARTAGRALLDLLYPPLCLNCRGPVGEPHNLCAKCWREISFIDGPACAACGLPFEIDPGPDTLCAACLAEPPAFDRARSAMRYDDASKGAILALKRADRLEFARLFAIWLRRSGQELLAEADVIVPVPLHPLRLWFRRYNQAALLGRRLQQMTGKPFAPLALVRTRSTPSQGKMPSAKARARNVQGAFKVPPRFDSTVRGRAVLLVDDVLTTGATVEACARALKRAGAARVLVLTIARVARPLPRAL